MTSCVKGDGILPRRITWKLGICLLLGFLPIGECIITQISPLGILVFIRDLTFIKNFAYQLSPLSLSSPSSAQRF